MENHFERAVILLQQRRFDLAEQELRRVLAEDPNLGIVHSYLAMALLGQERHVEARAAADTAIGLTPDEPFVHSFRSRVLADCNRYPSAEESARQAIRLDPEHPAHHEALAIALAGRKRWNDALAAVETALALDPEDADLLNLRARLLVLAGRHDEVDAATNQALRAAPDDADSHASAGYMHLNAGHYDEAFTHFREALRLEPESAFAKQGVIEAIKAKNRVYALMLRYFMWMESLGSKAIYLVIGGWLAMRYLSRISDDLPPWGQTTANAVLVLYVLFCVVSWIAWPLFNLMLRFHPFGRHVLSKRQKLDSTILGVALALSLVGFALMTLDGRFFTIGIGGVACSMLFAASNMHDGGRRWLLLGVVALGLALVSAIIYQDWTGGLGEERARQVVSYFIWTVLGGLILSNVLSIRPRRK